MTKREEAVATTEPGALSRSPSERLDSWKAIASYLRRDIRTVQRWETQEGLPVHRKPHDKLSSVYGYRAEIDQWWEKGDIGPEGAASGASAASRRQLLAVLPLRNLSGIDDQEYFSDGLTEELIAQLSRLNPGQLGVIAGASAMMFKQRSNKSVGQIGRELGAAFILDGSVRRANDRVRISVQLISARDQSHVWAESYDRNLRDILEVQSDVAQAVTRSISVTITAREQARLDNPGAVPPQAYEAYLKGRAFWNQRREGELHAAVRLFEQAIRENLNYAPAHAGIADCYALLASAELGAMPPVKAMPKAKSAAQKALQLDPQLAEAQTSLAYARLFYDWDWTGAEEAFKAAFELNPSYATCRHWYAEYLVTAGRITEALEELKRAQELDPLSPAIPAARAATLYFARRYNESVASCRETLAHEPNFVLAYLNLARAQTQKGEYGQAIEELRTAVSLTGDSSPMPLTLLGYTYGLAGMTKEAANIGKRLAKLAREKYVPALNFAIFQAGLGDYERMFRMLSKARAERCDYLVYLNQEPAADPIRSDPRFAKVVPTPPRIDDSE